MQYPTWFSAAARSSRAARTYDWAATKSSLDPVGSPAHTGHMTNGETPPGGPGSSPFDGFEHLSSGARFLRADLHMHCYGVSADVADESMTVDGIVQTAKARDLDVIAVTDHNAIDAVEALLPAAESEGLTAFPGVEITTGEGHVLVYFAPENYKPFAEWFGRLTFKQDQAGDRYTLTPIHELLEDVEKAGGIAIPAHISREKTGFLARVSAQIQEAVIASPALRAVEVDKAEEGAWYSAGDTGDGAPRRHELLQRREEALGPVTGPRIAKLLFSDAHSLESIGRDRNGHDRVTRIKMSKPTFGAFRTALADPEARIKLEADLPADYPRIVGVRLIGGFLDGQEIAFSSNLTCLIGGRGTGKSTAIESVRCTCLSVPSEIEGEPNCPDTVQLIYRDEYGNDHYLKRDADRATYERTDDGAVETSVAIEGYDQDRIAGIIRGYRDQPRLLLRFLDQFADLADVSETLASVAGDLETNAEAVRPLSDAPGKLVRERKQLEDTKLKLKAIEGSNLKEALVWRRRLQRERQVRQELEARLQELEDDIAELEVGIDLRRMAISAEIDDLSKTPSAAVLVGEDGKSGLVAAVEALDLALTTWRSDGQKRLATAKKTLDEGLAKWKEREQAIEGRVQKILEELRAQGINPNLAELNRLTAAETKSISAIRALEADVARLTTLTKERDKLLAAFRATQSNRFQLRAHAMQVLTAQLNEAFDDFKVKLGFREGELVDEYENWVREAIAGRFIRGARVTNLCRSVDPIGLAVLIGQGDVSKLRALKDDAGGVYFTSDEEAAEFVAALRQANLADLQQIALDDRPEISLTTEVNGEPRKIDFENLSFGQKASILLGALLFSSEQSPLIIDQPEDHLDSQFISRTVVGVLRRVKERRQVIIATHNANITVLGDAEQIVPLQGYQGKGRVREVGSVDATDTRKRTCEILEGGEAAYKRRGEMYGFDVRN
jgi:hypothetical protein